MAGLYSANQKITVTTKNSSSLSGNCYDANGTTFVEFTPPDEDQLSVEPSKPNSAQLTISFKKDANSYKFNYSGICVNTEKINGQVTKTIVFSLQKLEQPKSDTLSASVYEGLKVTIGSPKEFSSEFNDQGKYNVQVNIETKDATTNKSLGFTTLKNSINF